MVSMRLAISRSKDTVSILTAVLTLFHAGKFSLGNPEGCQTFEVELSPRKDIFGDEKDNVRMWVALPHCPSEGESKNFNVMKHCNAVHLFWGNSSYQIVVDLGASILSNATTEMLASLNKGYWSSLSDAERRAVETIRENLATMLFAHCGDYSSNMAQAALNGSRWGGSCCWFNDDGSAVEVTSFRWVHNKWS